MTAQDLVALHRFEDAVFAYERRLAAAPDDVETILDLAYLYSHVVVCGNGRGDALWRRAAAIAPRHVEALFWSSYRVVADGGTLEEQLEARERLLRVIELDPRNRSGYAGCAHALLGQHDGRNFAGAERVAHLEAAVRVSPDAPRFHEHLARAYERRGRLREALTHFERALAQSRLATDEPGDSRHRYKADVLEGRSVPRYVLAALRESIERVRRRLDAGGSRR